MLEDFFLHKGRIARIRGELLGSHVDAFCDDLGAQGYACVTIRRAVSAVVRFSRWLNKRRLGGSDISEDTIVRFFGNNRRRRRSEQALLHQFLQQLRRNGVTPEPITRVNRTHLERIETDFGNYLRLERGLAPITIQNSVYVARRFISQRFGTGPIDLSALNIQDIRAFVLGYARSRPVTVMRLMITSLRGFLRFLYLHGDISSQLADDVPRSPSWRQDRPPKWLGSDDIDLVLNRCERHSALGKRNYAILILLARLGLRAGEIASLKLDDIRWEAGEIIVCGKSQHKKRFPLLQDVGDAIATYLRDGRPMCGSRNVFVRAAAPYRELIGTSFIYFLVSSSLTRAGLFPPCRGPHLFRHSLATNMIHNGATLDEIGQILHHRDPNTTTIYAKVNIAGLRTVALPWPGEGS